MDRGNWREPERENSDNYSSVTLSDRHNEILTNYQIINNNLFVQEEQGSSFQGGNDFFRRETRKYIKSGDGFLPNENVLFYDILDNLRNDRNNLVELNSGVGVLLRYNLFDMQADINDRKDSTHYGTLENFARPLSRIDFAKKKGSIMKSCMEFSDHIKTVFRGTMQDLSNLVKRIDNSSKTQNLSKVVDSFEDTYQFLVPRLEDLKNSIRKNIR